MKCLQAGNPVVYGTIVGQNWFDYTKGQVLTIPEDNQGGHCTCLVGYVNGKFIGENSWGKSWGEQGYMRTKMTDAQGQRCNAVAEEAAFFDF